MTRITIDNATGDKLSSAREAVQLVDENGRILGTFKPADVPPYDLSLIPPISTEELRRRAGGPDEYTTAEVLKHLDNL